MKAVIQAIRKGPGGSIAGESYLVRKIKMDTKGIITHVAIDGGDDAEYEPISRFIIFPVTISITNEPEEEQEWDTE